MQNPFETFFGDSVYLEFKNHLFNYLTRVRAVRGVTQNYQGRSLEIGSGVSPVTDATVYTDLEPIAMKELARLQVNNGRHFYAVTDATQIAFKPGSFDSAVLSEVLEHIPDDRKTLSELAAVLRPGGHLVITVPANPHYWGFDDEYVHHERRYKISELIEKVNTAGFDVVRKKKVGGPLERFGTWLTVKLFLALFGKNDRKQSSPDRLRKCLPIYKALNQFLSALVRFDAWLMPESLTSIILLECRKK
ncbi:MAG: class I SAM-dependent methyltransferase [Candidatus Omnitrophica bacterium]|nr:class I SAM-dependent methyltransferase [Candidatus Omnitrophota bacterium]